MVRYSNRQAGPNCVEVAMQGREKTWFCVAQMLVYCNFPFLFDMQWVNGGQNAEPRFLA